MIIGYAPGVYDLFHVGHLNVLRRAKEHCDFLVAGVVSDEAAAAAKGEPPWVPLSERLEIVRHITFVDDVHVELAGSSKLDAAHAVGFHRIFKGDDWQGTDKGAALEASMEKVGVEVVYFPYTTQTSSTQLRKVLLSNAG